MAALIDRGCVQSLVDSVGGEYPARTDYGCFPDVGPQTPVGECSGVLAEYDPSVVFVIGRIFGSCPACDRGFAPSDCRPLVCEGDDQCPWYRRRDHDTDEVETVVYECRNGLCQDEDLDRHPLDEIGYSDAQLACLADVAREGENYEGESWCPASNGIGDDDCPLPLPDSCAQP